MKNELNKNKMEAAGSLTPALEGAARTASHDRTRPSRNIKKPAGGKSLE